MPRLKQTDAQARAIGQRVLELLAERKRSQEKLAYESSVPKATITNLIKGRARPSIVTLTKIADGLDVELLDLFTQPGESERHRLIDRTRMLTRAALRELADAAERVPAKKRGSPGL